MKIELRKRSQFGMVLHTSWTIKNRDTNVKEKGPNFLNCWLCHNDIPQTKRQWKHILVFFNCLGGWSPGEEPHFGSYCRGVNVDSPRICLRSKPRTFGLTIDTQCLFSFTLIKLQWSHPKGSVVRYAMQGSYVIVANLPNIYLIPHILHVLQYRFTYTFLINIHLKPKYMK